MLKKTSPSTSCSRCGAALPYLAAQGACTTCGHYIGPAAVIRPPGALPNYGTAWEHMGEMGVPRGFTLTLKESLFDPGRFFARLRLGTDPFMAWLFALTAASLGITASVLWRTFFESYLPAGPPIVPASSVSRLIFIPVVVTLQLGVVSLLCHFALHVGGLRQAPLSMTFSAACYAKAAAVLQVIPIAGGVASIIAFWIVLLIGLAGVHRSRIGRVTVNLLIPLLFPAAILVGAIVGGAACGIFIEHIFKETLPILR
ncbi:MAG: hypothetical protein GF344_01590 [Chitinivibrionales bacterium]|nr:hypothetical protein [Chitinivibrionales bacterium]MBD3355783.1 hypothetical protein [Chitinivibrionales bacterium]